MKIIYFLKDQNIPMYRWQHVHIFDELNRHGCSFKVFNPLNFHNTDAANEELISYLRKNRFDLFMTPHGHEDLYCDTILEIKKLSIPSLLFCCDNLIVPFMHEKNAKYFDVVWLTSPDTVNIFKKWNKNLIVLPYAANPYFFQPRYGNEINNILFIGTPYGSRKNTINKLIENNINVCLYANIENKYHNSKDQSIKDLFGTVYNLSRFKLGRRVLLSSIKHRLIMNKELSINNPHLEIANALDLSEMDGLFSSHSLSLSFTTALKTAFIKNPVPIINLRSFEIPMSGGLQFCFFNEELSTYFYEDKEIVFFKNDEEMLSKANFYLKPENHKVRTQMKLLARKRAENEHSWFCRFEKVFNKLGLSKLYYE